MKKMFIFSIALLLLFIINIASYSKVIWHKYFEEDSIAFSNMSDDNSLNLIENQFFLVFNGQYSGNSKYISTGFIVTDLYGNELNRYNLLREKNIMIKFIKEKGLNYHIISTYGYKDKDFIFMGKKVPHKLVLDKSFDIIEESCDTSNQSFYKGNWNYIILKDDSIYVDNGIYSSITKYYYDKISVLDLSTKFIREIEVDTLHQPNIWTNTNTNYFLVTKDNKFLIVILKSNTNTSATSDLILLNNAGKVIWKKSIKYKNKHTTIYKVIENKDGDFIGVGKTYPITEDKDTADIQRDSLLVIKVTKDGFLEWIKEYPLKNYTRPFYRITESKFFDSYIVYGSYIYKKDVQKNKYLNYYAIIDNNGNLTYEDYWTLDTSKDISPLSLLCIGDTLLFYGGIGSVAYGVEKLFLSAVIPDYTSVPNNFESEKNIITIYPNPAKDYIEINRNVGTGLRPVYNEQIKIYNAIGEFVMSVETHHDMSLQRIDISQLPRGVYYLQMGNLAKTFIKL